MNDRESILAQLEEKDHKKRIAVLRRIQKDKDTQFIELLIKKARQEKSTVVLLEFLKTIAILEPANIFKNISPYINSKLLRVKKVAISLVGHLKSKEVFDILSYELLKEGIFNPDEERELMEHLGRVLWKNYKIELINFLKRMLKDKEKYIRKRAVYVLGEIRSRELLKFAQHDAHISVRLSAIDTLKAIEQKVKHDSPELFEDEFKELEKEIGKAEVASKKMGITSIEEKEKLLEALSVSEDHLKIHIIQQLKKFNDLKADRDILNIFLDMLKKESNKFVIATLVKAVGNFKDPTLIKYIEPFLHHKDNRVVANSIEALDMIESERVFELLKPFISSKDNRIRGNAAVALWKCSYENALKLITEMLESNDVWMRNSAVYALGRIHTSSCKRILESLKEDEDPDIKSMVLRELKKFEHDEKLSPSIPVHKSESMEEEPLEDIKEDISSLPIESEKVEKDFGKREDVSTEGSGMVQVEVASFKEEEAEGSTQEMKGEHNLESKAEQPVAVVEEINTDAQDLIEKEIQSILEESKDVEIFEDDEKEIDKIEVSEEIEEEKPALSVAEYVSESEKADTQKELKKEIAEQSSDNKWQLLYELETNSDLLSQFETDLVVSCNSEDFDKRYTAMKIFDQLYSEECLAAIDSISKDSDSALAELAKNIKKRFSIFVPQPSKKPEIQIQRWLIEFFKNGKNLKIAAIVILIVFIAGFITGRIFFNKPPANDKQVGISSKTVSVSSENKENLVSEASFLKQKIKEWRKILNSSESKDIKRLKLMQIGMSLKEKFPRGEISPAEDLFGKGEYERALLMLEKVLDKLLENKVLWDYKKREWVTRAEFDRRLREGKTPIFAE